MSVTLVVGATVAYAGEWYRYQDETGVLVMSHYVPAEFASGGYTVVDDTGRVLRVVARQLSAEEIAAREREFAEQARLEAEHEAALERDRELLQLYAAPEEVEFARDRKLESIDELINTLKGDVQQLHGKRGLYETQAAEKERGQLPVSKEILTNLETVKHQIDEKQREIEARHREKEQVRVDYARDLDRIYELYALPRPIAAS